MSEASSSMKRLVSLLANDPDVAELVDEFLEKLVEDLPLIEAALADFDLESLRRLSHQLREAAEISGFTSIAESATHLEQQVTRVAKLRQVEGAAQELIELCRRAMVVDETA